MILCRGNFAHRPELQMCSAQQALQSSLKPRSRETSWLLRSCGSRKQAYRVERRGLSLKCRADHQAYPFSQEQYFKCVLQVASQVEPTAHGPIAVGNLIYMREEDVRRGADGRFLQIEDSAYATGKALVMAVGGDTLTCITDLLEGRSMAGRPYALDLLWMVLQRGQEISKREWKLLHVAVVALRGMVYTARLFFGDAETSAVVWDCDCRPSDACWLALKTKCPIYVNKSVWEDNAQSWRELLKLDEPVAEESATVIRPSDPEPVKRLKREMEVALSEEDYAAAARIRDHPYMMLFRRIYDHEKAGRREAAQSLRLQLEELIQDGEKSPLEGHKEL